MPCFETPRFQTGHFENQKLQKFYSKMQKIFKPTANFNEKNLSTNSPWGFEANLDTIDPN